MLLTKTEITALIAMDKVKANDETWLYPNLGGKISIPLMSADKREQFSLDITRGRIDLRKGTYQNRARQVIVLVRLDFGGSPHRNPDGEEMPCPHLHICDEKYGTKWAVAVPKEHFGKVSDPQVTLGDFMHFCHIVDPPTIQWSIGYND